MDDQIFLAVWIGSISLIFLAIGVVADGLERFFNDMEKIQSRDDR